MSVHGEHLAVILFVYGLAFFVMGLAIVLEVHPGSHWPWVATCGPWRRTVSCTAE